MRQNETPKRLSKRQQTDRLVTLIFSGKTNMTQNAKTLKIGRATAYRYWSAWIESEEAQQLDVEWWASFKTMQKKSPVKAFEGLTRLKTRKMPQKVEAKAEVTERFEGIIHLDVTEDEDNILNKAASILDKRLPEGKDEKAREREPESIH